LPVLLSEFGNRHPRAGAVGIITPQRCRAEHIIGNGQKPMVLIARELPARSPARPLRAARELQDGRLPGLSQYRAAPEGRKTSALPWVSRDYEFVLEDRNVGLGRHGAEPRIRCSPIRFGATTAVVGIVSRLVDRWWLRPAKWRPSVREALPVLSARSAFISC